MVKKHKKYSSSLYSTVISFVVIFYSIGGLIFDTIDGVYIGSILLGGIIFFLSVSIYSLERMQNDTR